MSVSISGSGQVPVQVVQTVKTDTFATTSTSLVDITGLSVTITPTSASNRILIILDVKGWAQNSMQGGLRLLRGSTGIYVGDTAGSRISVSASGFYASGSPTNIMNGAFAVFLDSPATTSATTYKLQGYTNSSTLYINRSNADGNDNDNARAASSITVMEISG